MTKYFLLKYLKSCSQLISAKPAQLLFVLGITTIFIACAPKNDTAASSDSSDTAASAEQEVYEWKMVTSWPKNFPGLGIGANNLGALIEEMSGGRIKVTVYGAGELVGPFEVFDAVSRGTAELGHSAAYYWSGKNQAVQFFSSVPFGLTAQEMNGWLYYGGGMELWQKIYGKYNLIPLAAGNAGVQMGGWFNKEINSLEDLKGIKMRIPGLGGKVLNKAGGIAVSLPGGELFAALQSGAIDATEWVGPYNDLAFGFYKVARYYYYPGWHEPGTTLEGMINKDAFEALPADLQSIVLNAAKVINQDMLADFTAANNRALNILVQDHQVELRRYPQEVINELARITNEVLETTAAEDPEFKEVYDSFNKFRVEAIKWHSVSELPYLEMREKAFK